jgi:hypothetical protein
VPASQYSRWQREARHARPRRPMFHFRHTDPAALGSWLLGFVMRSRNLLGAKKTPELLPLGASDSPTCEPMKEDRRSRNKAECIAVFNHVADPLPLKKPGNLSAQPEPPLTLHAATCAPAAVDPDQLCEVPLKTRRGSSCPRRLGAPMTGSRLANS